MRQLHNIQKNRSNRKAIKVGRGGTRGKTSGRGTKGQNARAGRKKRPEMRDIIKKIPKLRGRGRNFLKTRFSEAVPVSVSAIDSKFSSGERVTPKTLLEKGLISRKSGKFPRIKILGKGKLTKKLTFKGVELSSGVKNL